MLCVRCSVLLSRVALFKKKKIKEYNERPNKKSHTLVEHLLRKIVEDDDDDEVDDDDHYLNVNFTQKNNKRMVR